MTAPAGESIPKTWWQEVRELHNVIQREHTITPILYVAVVDLRELLDEWVVAMDTDQGVLRA